MEPCPLASQIETNPTLLDRPWIFKMPRANELTVDAIILKRRSPWITAAVTLRDAKSSTTGYGTRVFARSALRVAFAEAWERSLLSRCASDSANAAALFSFTTTQLNHPNPRSKKVPHIKSTSSNGFAAGSTLRRAMTAAASELFERHCLLQVWNEEAKALPLYAMPPLWLAPTRALGWHFTWFELGRGPQTVTVACLARHPQLGARFDLAAKSTRRVALKEATVSVMKMIHHLDAAALNFSELWKKGEPLAHLAYYSKPENLRAFDFMDQSNARESKSYLDYDPDLIPLWVADHMPAVAQARWHQAKSLEWGSAALQLCPQNPHPHPLA